MLSSSVFSHFLQSGQDSSTGLTQTEAYLATGLLGALVAVVVMIVRDVIIEGYRSRRRRKRGLIDRKLSKIYSPLWIAIGGEQGQPGNILNNPEAVKIIGDNFHLIRADLQSLLNEVLGMGKTNKDGLRELSEKEASRLLEITPGFKKALWDEIQNLRKEFEKI